MFYIPFLALIFNAYESNAVISKVVKKKKMRFGGFSVLLPITRLLGRRDCFDGRHGK